jgi:hypothetical protein
MHDLLLIPKSNEVYIGHILRDIVDFTIYELLNLPPFSIYSKNGPEYMHT